MTKSMLKDSVLESCALRCHKVLQTGDHLVSATFTWAGQSSCCFLWNQGLQTLYLRSEVSDSSSPSSSFSKSCLLRWSCQETNVTDASHTVTSLPALHCSASLSLSQITVAVGLSAQPAGLPTLGASFHSFQKLLEKYMVIHLSHVSTLFECFAQELALDKAQVGTSCKHLGTLCFAVD